MDFKRYFLIFLNVGKYSIEIVLRNIRRCNLRTNYIEPNKYVLQNMNEYKVCVLYELMSFFGESDENKWLYP